MIKLRETIMILDLHQQGLTVSAISRETGIDRKTVRKYIERGLCALSNRKKRERDPYLTLLPVLALGGKDVANQLIQVPTSIDEALDSSPVSCLNIGRFVSDQK
ncbi:helix-turn-helix domain-containing protein [Ensifer sp. R-19]|uniref:helix-turn-helix domain-containing protein n=1 Tax=Ensifer sp. R-19 TaxID=3404055 RepID=UPI003CF420E5